MNTFLNDNSLKSEFDPEIVMQSTSYNCGPAALATVLQGMGISCSEYELAQIAGTDETGTTMYGLMRAAIKKGLDARGMRVKLDNLDSNNIVFLNIDGKFHYSVIGQINGNTVILADPALGKIEITKNYFARIYSGNALIISK
jgi:predicted double-glycine peptidase